MKGREGSYNSQTEDVVIKGNVRVSSKKDGFRLTTERLRYSGKAGVVSTKGRFHMSSIRADIKGRGMEMDMVEENLKVLSEVVTVFHETASK